MSDQVKVAIRVRPLIERENVLKINWKVSENTIFQVDPSNGKPRGEIYTFDHIFDTTSTNCNVFDKVVKPLVDSAVKGYNATIFAYGQTSSGKTYTMLGSKKESGIIQQAVQYMFETIKQSSGREFLVRASYLEIYNEKVSDLLEEGKGNLKIREMDGNIIVVNLKEDLVASTDKVMALMNQGEKIRHFGETSMSSRSSRSHTIFRIIIESQSSEPGDKGAVQVSHLNLVDLAGSERVDQSGATGDRLKEGCAINRSLFMLGHVISKLSEGHKQHINFRDSKLTRILQPSLGGNALILIICTVTPAVEEETLCTLGFASRAKMIKIEPHVNEFELDGTLLQRYARQLILLRNDFQDMRVSNFCRHMVAMEGELWKKYSCNESLPDHLSLPKSKLILHGRSDRNESKKRQSQRRVRYISRTCHRTYSSVLSETHLETIEEEPSLPHSFSESNLDLFYNELYLQLPLEEFELDLVRSNVNLDCTSSPVLSDKLLEEPIFMSHTYSNENKPVCSLCLPVEDRCDASCQTELVDSSSETNSTPPHELRERISFWQNECELQRIEFEEEKQFALWEKDCMSDHPQLDQYQHLTLPDIIMEENNLREEVTKKNAMITDLQEQLCGLQVNHSELWQTKEALQALQGTNYKLLESLSQKNNIIDDVNEKLLTFQELHSKCLNSIMGKNNRIQVLEEQLSRYAVHADENDNRIQELTEELSKYASDITGKDNKIEVLEEELSRYVAHLKEKDNRIQVLEEQLSRYAVHVDENDNRIQELTEELSKYASDITGKDNKIEVLEEELSRYVANLREKDNRIQVLEEQLSRYAVNVVEKNSTIQKLTEELSKYASDITGKDNKIEVLEEELSRYVVHIREKDNRIQELKEELCINVADIDEKKNRILELADLLSSVEEQLEQCQKLNTEKDIRIQDLTEKVIAVEAIMSMAQELGNKVKTGAPKEDTSCSEKCLPVSPEKYVTDDVSLEESCENIETRRFNLQLDECSWYLNISDIEQAIGNMQKRIFELKKRTDEFDSVLELFPDNGITCKVISKEITHADGPEKILKEEPINSCVYNKSYESTQQHLFDTEVETCLKSENCYLKSLLVQILTEIHKKQLQLSQTMDEKEKMNTEVKSLRNELQKLQFINNNNSSLSVYDVCLELLKQQNLALKDSLDEIRSYRKCLVNEVIDLDPSRDQQSLQECELTELLGTFNECIMKKEEEVFSDLQSRCEELTYDNNNMTQLIQALEKKIHDKDKEIKSLTDASTNFQTDNEKLVSDENQTHIEEELGSAQLQEKLIKEEVNFLTAKIAELGKIETFSTEIQHLFNMIPELDSESDITTIISTIIEKVNLAKTLNEEMLVLKNRYDELNQKNNSLKKHIECLEVDLQEKEEENKEFVCKIKNLQNDKEVLTIKVNEKVRTVERLEQEVQLVHGELSLVKQLKEEAESFSIKSLRLEKLELIIGEIKQLSIFIPELASYQDNSLLTVIPLIKQKLSSYQKMSEKNAVFKEQLTELKEECYKMKREIENLELDIQRKTYDNNEMKESLRSLRNDKESLLLSIKNQTQCLEMLRKELDVTKANQLDVKDLKDELLTKSQQLEKLEIINVEIQQLITSALEWNVSPDCDLVTTVHLLIQKIGHAQILAEDTIHYKDNLKESEIQCEKLKNHITCLEQEIQEKNTKIKDLSDINNNLQIIKDKHVLQIIENEHNMNMMEQELKGLQSQLKESNGLMNKASSVEVTYGPACSTSSISHTELNSDVTSLDNLLIQNASEARLQTAEKKCKNQKVMKPLVHSMNKHENDISSKIPLGAKEMNDTIQTLQTNSNRLQHQVQNMRKEIENVIADRKKLEFQMGQKDKEIEILQSGRKKYELEAQCLKKRAKSFLAKQKEVEEIMDQQRQEIEKALKDGKEFELQYLQMKKEAENMLTDREKFREEVTLMKIEIEKLIEEREMYDSEIERLKAENEKLKYNVQHLKELETAEKKMKELFASIPEIDSSHGDFESAINIIGEKINTNKSQKQASNTNVENNTQTMYNRLKRQVRNLDKIKKICSDLEDKADCLEECKKALEMKLREKTNAIDQLEADKIDLLTKISYYSEKLQITEQYLTQLGYKWDDKLLIYCAPPMLPDVKTVQLRVKELEQQVSDLKMELKQKSIENEGAFNLATDLDKTKSEYETKYHQVQTEMRNLRNQMLCLANNGMMKTIYKPSDALVSVAVNTDESAEYTEYKRYKTIGSGIHHLGSEMDHSDIRTSICKHKVNCGELLNERESKNLEKCLEEARSQIYELSSEVKSLRKKHSATLIQALRKMKNKTVQTDEESLVFRRLCSEGSGIVSEHELLQALERVKKLEKEKKMLKALSRERLLRLYIAEGKIKPLTSSKSTVPQLSPEKLTILNRYTQDISATSCENGTTKNIISDR